MIAQKLLGKLIVGLWFLVASDSGLPVPQCLVAQEVAQSRDFVGMKTIGLNQKGELIGTLVTATSSFGQATPATGVKVLISRNGKLLGETKTDSDGLFRFPNGHTGVYSLLAVGKAALLATAVEVVEFENGQPVPTLVVMAAPLGIAGSVLRNNEKKLMQAAPVMGNGRKANLIAVKAISPSVSEGEVMGQIIDSAGNLSSATVFLVKEGKIVESRKAVAGKYSLPFVRAGVYSLLVVGESGFSVLGIEVTKGPAVMNVAFRGRTRADISLAEGKSVGLVIKAQQDEEKDEVGAGIPGSEMPGNGSVGGVAGAGGGGFAVDGATLAGVAGIGGLIGFAILDDDSPSPAPLGDNSSSPK